MSGLTALTVRELKKWYKQPIVLFMSIIQPIIWMVLFGKAFNLTALAPPGAGGSSAFQELFGTSDYFSFMAVGMLSFVVLFATMFSGMSIVWDRRLGFLNKLLSTPVSRGSIILSKVFNAVTRALVQSAIVLAAAVVIGLKAYSEFNPLNLIGVFAALFLMSVGLSSLFVLIAIRSTRWETQMAVMNLLNLPLLFASNALFPTKLMPSWLEAFSRINPVTYGTDVARQLILMNPSAGALTGDFLFLGAFAALFATIGIVMSWRFLNK
jgi:ABC-2 type transport system permease protein